MASVLVVRRKFKVYGLYRRGAHRQCQNESVVNTAESREGMGYSLGARLIALAIDALRKFGSILDPAIVLHLRARDAASTS